jgi:hypothetical protein
MAVEPRPEVWDQVEGYLVVQRPAAAARTYATEGGADAAARALHFRQVYPEFGPERYRGISRFPLGRYAGEAPEDVSGFLQVPDSPVGETEAEKRMAELLGPDPTLSYDVDFDPDLLPTLDVVHDVFSRVTRPVDWEVVRVRRSIEDVTPDTLGFDVGYWGSDHFSLPCDCVVMPMWHPPPPEDYDVVRRRLERLNEHRLFPTAADARSFRTWYVAQPWAETESHAGDFHVIRVERVPDPT